MSQYNYFEGGIYGQKRFEQFNELHLGFIELSKVINEVIEEQNIEISREQMGVFKLLFENKQMTMKKLLKGKVFLKLPFLSE